MNRKDYLLSFFISNILITIKARLFRLSPIHHITAVLLDNMTECAIETLIQVDPTFDTLGNGSRTSTFDRSGSPEMIQVRDWSAIFRCLATV